MSAAPGRAVAVSRSSGYEGASLSEPLGPLIYSGFIRHKKAEPKSVLTLYQHCPVMIFAFPCCRLDTTNRVLFYTTCGIYYMLSRRKSKVKARMKSRLEL